MSEVTETVEDQKKLTPKEKAWADAYLITLSKAGAARIAKYKGDSKTLAHIGWENYRKAHIQAYMKDKLDKMAMPANEVLARLGAMASSNLSDFAFIKTGKDLEECEDGAVVKKFKREIITDQLNRQHEKIEIELYDAQAALVHIAKAHGLFTDKVELSWRDKLPPDKDPDEVKRQFVEMMKLAAKNANE